MFICSIRASTIKVAAVVLASAAAVAALAIFVPDYKPKTDTASVEPKINYKVKNTDEIKGFLDQFGWQVENEPVDEAEVTIPEEFDSVYESYNTLQKKQGFDLSKYKRKTVKRYTYKIENYEGYSGMVLADVIVYKNKVIGGDICSADVNGFLHGFSPDITLP